MTEIIDFLVAPYLQAPIYMVWLEFAAAVFGVASVYYAKKESILLYPVGIISTAIYVYLLSQWSLYGDLIINIYYTLMSIYGWYIWYKVDDTNAHLPISFSTRKDKLEAFGIFLFTSIFVIIVYRYYNVIPNNLDFTESIEYAYTNMFAGNMEDFRKITPFLDTFTTGIFFAAMWQMANKKIENWLLWIAGNIVSIPLYFVKGFGFTGIQYSIFLVLAVMGYQEWRKKLQKPNAEPYANAK